MSVVKWFYTVAGMSYFLMPAVVPVSAAQAADSGLSIPSSIKAEHKELHADLARVVALGGKTGAIAKEVENLLHPHFVKEEEFAMPPLGLLASVSAGKMPRDAEAVIKMTERLKADMPAMLAEHQKIGAALQRLRTAAKEEGKPEAAQFADHLLAHAKQEEQILYPAAMLVGDYLKLKR